MTPTTDITDRGALAATVAAALSWLYETEQPDGALVTTAGVELPIPGQDRTLRVTPRELTSHPTLTLSVYPGRQWACPAAAEAEAEQLLAVTAELEPSADSPFAAASFVAVGLYRQAHPTLLHAVREYELDCPDHARPLDRPGNRSCVRSLCAWWPTGRGLLVEPAVLDHADR